MMVNKISLIVIVKSPLKVNRDTKLMMDLWWSIFCQIQL